MSQFYHIFYNYILMSALAGWFSAQVIKFIIILIVTGKPDPERLFGSGGMPSAHTAMVCSMTIAAAKSEGTSSPIFAIAFILACIVMYDAMGVRRAAGEQAKVINKMVLNVDDDEDDEDEFGALKEKLGHTPLEVLGGALLGILVPMVLDLIVH